MNNFWLKKIGYFVGIFLLVLLFNLNKSQMYEAETDILLLPKNEDIAREQDLVIENFRQILMSLAFNDRIAEGSDALEAGVELPNYKRKEFWNSKISVTQLEESGAFSIENFDQNSSLARELNSDTVEGLIAVAGNYYDIEKDLEIRIIDGPIVKRIISQNPFLTIGKSVLWSVGLYLILFLIFPFVFIKKEKEKREIPGRDFSYQKKELPRKTIPTIFPEEENYFAAKNFFEKTEKTKVAKEILPQKNTFSLPNFPSFGKKAPIPANLPVNEGEVPDIFRQKEVLVEKVTAGSIKNDKMAQKTEYVPHEATPEEVKARLNRLLGGVK